ncbi:hypothetical protein B0H14DRAFT_2622951 [Mycena olivaceomarginata]|nr:hypothetical protein B0H14DRAFT_2622951 [Mycena olivaceomarginata]
MECARKLGSSATPTRVDRGLHVRGTILGLNADMEVAPLLGLADAFLPIIDRDELFGVVTEAGTLLLFVLRLCYTHIFGGISEAPHLSNNDHDRIQGFVHLESSQAVEDFKVWIANLPDPDGAIARWWKQKLQHFWLLPAAIQCLSRIPLNDWHTIPATTNLGEAQHARNDAETGTQVGIIESFKIGDRYLNNNQNELVHRYDSSNRCHAAATNKWTVNPRQLHSRRAKSPSPALKTSAPLNAKRKLTSAAVAPTPKPKRRKAGDPLAGWAIELVPGDKTTAVTPREYAQKEPEEFAAQYPQYVKFL